MNTAQTVVEKLSNSLGRAGIDCVTPLALGWYNDNIPREIGARIPACGAAGQSALAVLVGNSRAIWEPFLEACAADNLLQLDNPLEAYLQQHVCSSLAACAPGLKHRIYWSHRRTADLEGGSEHVAFQRMAHHAGLAYLDETCHLCLHPRFGPWFSLRCVVIFDDIAYDQPRPAELRNPLPKATQRYVKMAMHTAVHNTSRKFRLPEVDVEAAEAVLAEASMEPVLDDEDETEEQAGAAAAAGAGPGSCAGSSARSTAGSEAVCSGGTTPAASSGCSSPRSGVELDEGSGAATQAGLQTVASRLVATPADPVAVPASAAARLAASAASPPSPALGSPSPPAVGSLSSCGSQRSSLEGEGKPCMRAVAQNWRAWVGVRDSPCPGHPMRYSEEQIVYHYTRDKTVLRKALLRRNLGPATPHAPATGLLDPAAQSFHAAAMEAAAKPQRSYQAPAAAEPITAA